MSAFRFLNVLLLLPTTTHVLESINFMIYNENLNRCLQSQPTTLAIRFNYCNKDDKKQMFKWTSQHQLLNIAQSSCLGARLDINWGPVKLWPCNKTSELQTWECRNDTFLTIRGKELFLQPVAKRSSDVRVDKELEPSSTWKIYGTSTNLCSKGYEAVFSLGGNSFGAPCVFPFKYMNRFYAECTRDDEETGRLWCGTTANVDEDSLTGYCPVKDNYDGHSWITNHLTGGHYQINSQSALTWNQARKSCQQQNAELLSITEFHEQAYLTGLTSSINTDYWIGLNSLNLDSGWQWTGDHPFRYLNWAPGSPSRETGKLCVSMQSQNGKWENNKCDKKLGYICQKGNSSLDTPAIPSEGLKPIKCPDGWMAYAGHCYLLRRDRKTWKDALSSCRKEGGDLTSIHNIEEHSFVISQLDYKPNDVLWIGLNDQKMPMYFEWSDGAAVTFTKWQHGEPTHETSMQQDCVLLENGYYADYLCEEKFGYICKRDPLAFVAEEAEDADPTCHKGWKRHGFYCYLIGQSSVTFSEAKTFCEANKGSLTSVEDRYEQAFLTSLVGLRPEKYFWIGLSDTDAEQPGTFNWTNGERVLFTNWNSGMPGQHPGCVAMRTGTAGGLWDVLSCTEKAVFLCKQWAEGVTPPPVVKTTPAPPCPDGWLPSQTSSFCFKVFQDVKQHKRSWFEAQDFCRAIGGDLASLHSMEDQRTLEQPDYLSDTWIGLRSNELSTGFSWSDGSPVDFEHWGYWSLAEENKGCVVFQTYSAWWTTTPCEHLRYWTCHIKRGVLLKPEPTNTFDYSFKRIEDGWILYENNEFYFSNRSLPMQEARRFCRKHDGDLAVIEGEDERKFLWKYNVFYGTGVDAYIGLIVSLDRKFSWLDGTLVTYAAWAPNEPNFKNDDENCVVMYTGTGLWNDINCGAEKSFICERHNSSVRLPVAPTSPAPLGGCAEGWHLFNNKCFQVFGFNKEERKNWSDARTACRNLGGNLASITRKDIEAFLIMHLQSVPTDTWTGLNDINWGHRFLWTDGSGVSYTNWAPGYPDFRGDCVAMIKMPKKMAGSWENTPCSRKKSYFCQRNSDPMVSVSRTTVPASGYTLYGNSSYAIGSPKMTWEEARKKCHSENAELASILDPYSQSFLWLQVLKYGEPMWIGLNSNVTDENYKWAGNWKSAYTNWAREEPKQKIACVYLDLDGYWKTKTCNEKFFFVCRQTKDTPESDIPQSPGKCPKSTGNSQRIWIPFRAHCYTIQKARSSWSMASLACTQLGAHLTSIEDLAELNFLLTHTELLDEKNFWIGLVKDVDGNWIWLDSTPVNFVNWKKELPTITPDIFFIAYGHEFSHQCVYINKNGEWSNYNCYVYNMGYICKRHKIIDTEPINNSSATKEQVAHPSPHSTVVIIVIVAIFVLTSAAFVVYVFYQKRRNQRLTVAGFQNSLYQDNTVSLQENDSERLVDSFDNKEAAY